MFLASSVYCCLNIKALSVSVMVFFFTSEALNDRNKHFTLCCFCISIFVSEHLSVNPSSLCVCQFHLSILPSSVSLQGKFFFRAAWKALLARYGRFSTTDSSSSVWDVAFPWAGLCWPHHLLWCKRLVVESSFLLLLLLFLFLNSGFVAICLTKFVIRERKNIFKNTQKWGAGRVQTHLCFCFLL